jgi:anaerobic selenocysteine-containing dehydrogenase
LAKTALRTAFRTCPLCEATCGLELTLEGRDLVRVRGDHDDVFSHGYLCPKAIALVDLENDPDRIRTPLVREGKSFREASWEEAFERVAQGVRKVIDAHGPNAVALYAGNPNAHNLSGTYLRVLLQALRTQNFYSASTVDQMPKQVSAGMMFGTLLSIPVPDVDRCEHLLMLGANPFVSNGSLFTAPALPDRLRALRRRGGKLVVVDPRFTQTAKEADEHHFIVPGTDALLLFAIVHTLFDEGLVRMGPIGEHTNGVDDVRALASSFAPETVSDACGIGAEQIRRMAREVAGADRAAVYARIGTCTQEFGTLASWLVDVVNVLAGNLDRLGGAMFAKGAAGAFNTTGTPGAGRGVRFGRWHSRVRGAPEVYGELPVACLTEEIETPGEGQIRAMISIAGNPASSTPDAARLDRALASLEFMVSVDIYVNETTRHADVILPAQGALTRGHYDIALYQLACRNVAHYSPPALELAPGEMHEWEVLLRLAAIAAGQADTPAEIIDEMVAREALRRAGNPDGAWEAVAHRRGPERVLDILLRTGPYDLSLEMLEQNPHGVDLGPLEPRIPEVLRTPSGRIELAPPALVDDVARLRAALARTRNGGVVLVGRRQLRSNNSWMHNLGTLRGGTNVCTLQIHPDDAERFGVEDGKPARVTSSAGTIDVPAEVTDAIMPGVVSIPHGWGLYDGANSNTLAPADLIDPLSGNAVLNGIPVTVAPA